MRKLDVNLLNGLLAFCIDISGYFPAFSFYVEGYSDIEIL